MPERPGGALAVGRWLIPAVLLALLDQLSKQWVAASLQPGESVPVAPFFNLVLWFNAGAAFSFLAGAEGWQRWFFIGIAVAAVLIIIWLLRRYPEQSLFCAGLSLILGGALGNLWDRVMHGHVVDFLLFHAGGYYWPAFNLADTAITIGVGLIILDGFVQKKHAAGDP